MQFLLFCIAREIIFEIEKNTFEIEKNTFERVFPTTEKFMSFSAMIILYFTSKNAVFSQYLP